MSDDVKYFIFSMLCVIAADVSHGWISVVYGVGAAGFATLALILLWTDRIERKRRERRRS